MIGIDWGTTNFRAYRLDDAGELIEQRSAALGILNVKDRNFEEALRSQVQDWLSAGETRILLSGMIGSRQGWVEARYVPCPARLQDLSSHAIDITFAGASVRLVPGVAGADIDGVPEVMRGEETQAMAMLDGGDGSGLACLPGTHSKWITMRDRAIADFSTFMTGDVFAALRSSTILSRQMSTDDSENREAFLRGAQRASQSGGLLHHLFGVRTLALMKDLQEEDSASYLSGLLIGHEVQAAMPAKAHVRLVGDARLCSLYALAIGAAGGSSIIEAQDAAARGLAAIGGRITWI